MQCCLASVQHKRRFRAGDSSLFLFSTEKRLFISKASIRLDLSQTASLFRLLVIIFGGNCRNKCFVLLYLNDSIFFRTNLFPFYLKPLKRQSWLSFCWRLKLGGLLEIDKKNSMSSNFTQRV